jgi:hypothetical protein
VVAVAEQVSRQAVALPAVVAMEVAAATALGAKELRVLAI